MHSLYGDRGKGLGFFCMKILIFGATGGTGRELVSQGLKAGHTVTAFARNEGALEKQDNLRVFAGDALSRQDVSAAIAGQEAVLSALGSRSLAKSDLLERSMENILAGMRQHSVRRLIVLGASGALHDADKNLSLPQRAMFSLVSATILKQPFLSQAAMQRLIEASDADWTIVQPPRLTDAPRTGKYRVAADALPAKGTRIPRADVAAFMLQQLGTTEWVRRSPYLAT